MFETIHRHPSKFSRRCTNFPSGAFAQAKVQIIRVVSEK